MSNYKNKAGFSLDDLSPRSRDRAIELVMSSPTPNRSLVDEVVRPEAVHLGERFGAFDERFMAYAIEYLVRMELRK